MAFADFERILSTAIGLHAASIGAPAISRAVLARMAACQLEDPEAYRERVRTSELELQQLIEAVVVPETWFFRDRESFAALGRLAREEWLPAHSEGLMTLLSVPCSTGEEPYSMAMALLDAGVPGHRFRIDAVDISERALAHAERAVYGRNSFRGDDLAFRDRHFQASGTGYRPSEAVRQQVRFRHGNLFALDFLPGPDLYDILFCRNVLIYFDRGTQDRAILVAKRLLKATGVLFVAPAETALPPGHGFISIKAPLAFAFRKAQTHPAVSKRQVARTAGTQLPTSAVTPVRVALGTAVTPARSAAASRPAPPEPVAPGIEEAAALADQGRFTEAAMCCEALIRRHGPSAPALYLLGLVRDATGNDDEAIDCYRKALYLDPDHVDTQVHLAFLMEKRGDPDGAQVLRNRARRQGLKRVTPHA